MVSKCNFDICDTKILNDKSNGFLTEVAKMQSSIKLIDYSCFGEHIKPALALILNTSWQEMSREIL